VTPAEQIRAFVIERGGRQEQVASVLAALDALEADHADRVWLTREEAKRIRGALSGPGNSRLCALLDERIGEKP
jgi:hypothetical protein